MKKKKKDPTEKIHAFHIRKRMKATPDEYPGVGPIDLDRAYGELPASAFRMWIRMMVAPQEVLNRGRNKTSRLLGYSIRQGNEIYRVLERFGYITFIRRNGVQATQISIQRRCIIPSRSHFVRVG